MMGKSKEWPLFASGKGKVKDTGVGMPYVSNCIPIVYKRNSKNEKHTGRLALGLYHTGIAKHELITTLMTK
jgi:hypothetical protein